MDIAFLIKGVVIGFSIAAPVGPIGILCIRRTLAEGRVSGLVTGLGAATADALYGAAAGFGLTSLSLFLMAQQLWLRLVGGVFLLYLGIRTFLARPAEESAPTKAASLPGAFASTFLLTLANPMTILSFAAIFAGLGIASTGGSHTAAAMLVLGVFLGSAFWWLILSTGLGISRSRFSASGLGWANRIAGVAIIGFGLFALAGLRR